eukprot:1224976-Rhodomonas_salina.1
MHCCVGCELGCRASVCRATSSTLHGAAWSACIMQVLLSCFSSECLCSQRRTWAIALREAEGPWPSVVEIPR